MPKAPSPHQLLTICRHFALISAVFAVLAGCTRQPPKPLLASVPPEQLQQEIRKHYLLRCSSCHGQFGEGYRTGPNLTDDYWIHGEGTKADLVNMITNGVVKKGMPAWKNVFHADDISALADLVQSFQGTNPKNAKAPQGKQITTKIEVITPNSPTMSEPKKPLSDSEKRDNAN